MEKKILLFWPNTANRGRITMSMPILSAISKNMGWKTKYFDTSFYDKSDDAVIEKEKTGAFKEVNCEETLDIKDSNQIVLDFQNILDEYKPDVLAITGMTSDFQYMMNFFPKLNIPKDCVVAFGGSHSLNRSEEILNTGMIHLSCFGQGELILPEILRRVEEGRSLDGIPGTCHINNDTGQMVKTNLVAALPAEELWSVKPDYSFYDERYYTYPFDGKIVNMFWLEVGRGCPFSCTYCDAPQIRNMYKGVGKYFISRPLDDVFNTIHNVLDRYDVDVFNITHECFLSQKKSWIKDFCERWGKEVKKSFLIQTRMETVDTEKLDMLKLSNAPIIQIGQGIESGNKRILNEICNRKMNIPSVIESYQIMKEQGFRTNAYYMIGFPTETREEIFETIELCKKVNSDIDSVSIFQPFPGLPLTELCIKNGWISGDEEIPTFTEKSIINQPSISPDELKNLRRVFLLYAKLPKEYWQDIKKCEDNFEENQKLFNELIDIRWRIQGKNISKDYNVSEKK